jgi:hypothetical protein
MPPVERFSSFLRDTNNSILQTISNSLVKELILLGEISGTSLSIDSYPIPANVKQNNLKTNVKDSFDKYCIPKSDPDCLLGPTVQFLPAEKKISFFWRYRNHTITDMPSELPVIETIKPANVADIKLFIPLFRQLRDTYNINPQTVLGDSIYDSEHIHLFVIDELNSLPRIDRNYRWKKHRPLRLSPRSKPLYLTGFNRDSPTYEKKQCKAHDLLMIYSRMLFPPKNESFLINKLPDIENAVKNKENVKFPGHCLKYGRAYLSP